MRTLALVAVLLVLRLSPSVHASTSDALSLEDLQDQSALVVLGEVVETGTRLEGGVVVTDTEIRVADCLTGLCPEDLTVTCPGGALGGQTERVEGAPHFEQGQQVVVFLRPQDGRFEVVGMAQGLFLVERSANGPVAVSDRSGLLDAHGRPALPTRIAYPLDDLVDGIRLGTPVTPLAPN
jgi:hypothetical protein